MGTGLYRFGGLAQVSYEHLESIPISRTLFEQRPYLPPFDELPSKEEYEARTGQSQP